MNPHAEWLETDGLGGFASGRVDGVRTRRYHALLLAATTPPTGRHVLVNGLDAWIETADGRFALSSQRYAPNVTHPDGASRLVAFAIDPWPCWTYRLPSGLEVVHELIVRHGAPVTALAWRLSQPADAKLLVRPFLSGRDTHSAHHENAGFRFEAELGHHRVSWRPYPGVPAVVVLTNGHYAHDPQWYRSFQYDEERARGLDYLEDLASPGVIEFDLSANTAILVFSADLPGARTVEEEDPIASWKSIVAGERTRRSRFRSSLHRAADDYIVRRGNGRTVVAGYPWFSDWGRDTFIALRGLCIAGDRLTDARDILLEWSRHVSEGMLPNFFPEGGDAEYNAVDASLWFVIAVHELLEAASRRGRLITRRDRAALVEAMDAILSGYTRGTRYHIHADDDGLLAAGEPGVQLTWMDARVDGREITSRIGKPVEVQALWYNALRAGETLLPHWRGSAERVHEAFARRFWDESLGCLADVVDVDHHPGFVDRTVRPNQIFAVGGLPFILLDGERARRVVDVVERTLWTPAGLRSLDPSAAEYVPRYGGDPRARDGAYHQGTVWPWLMGAFIDAWVRVHRGGHEARAEADRRFLQPLVAHYADAVLGGHIAEIADADAPHESRGCPFQAWSVGEALRAEHLLRRAPVAVDVLTMRMPDPAVVG